MAIYQANFHVKFPVKLKLTEEPIVNHNMKFPSKIIIREVLLQLSSLYVWRESQRHTEENIIL